MESANILLVEDDIDLTRAMGSILRDAGHRPVIAHTAEDGWMLAQAHEPDLALLDIMVPVMGGWELCRRLRTQFALLPIIFLTALGNTENIVRGLGMGADDYLVKPIDAAELKARIEAHLRRVRPSAAAETTLNFGDGELVIDFPARRIMVKDREVELTPREYDLLATLARNAGRVVSTAELVQTSWGISHDASLNVKPYIHYLRKKLEVDPASPRWILTVRGIGYRFNDR